MGNKVLEVKNISKSYQGRLILNDISLTCFEHDVISIIGGSGAGKSTFLRCMNLLTPPSAGEIFVNEEQIPLINRKGELQPKKHNDLLKLRQSIGFVFQSFNLWQHKTSLENIIEAPIHVLKKSKAEAIEQAEFLLNKVGLHNKKNNYPNELSGGEQQRVAIARTLALNPSIILLDEPTSSLDPEKTKEVTNVLKQLAEEGTSMIIVTHDIGVCKSISSRVVFLNNGVIEEEGKVESILYNPNSVRLQQFLNSVL